MSNLEESSRSVPLYGGADVTTKEEGDNMKVRNFLDCNFQVYTFIDNDIVAIGMDNGEPYMEMSPSMLEQLINFLTKVKEENERA